MTVGEKIAMLRKRKNFTQEQLAELLEVSRQSVSRWEINLSFPETEKLIRLSKLFSCSVDFLLSDGRNTDENNFSEITADSCAAFLKECGYFFLATSVADTPRLRPFGMICSCEDALFIVTDKQKSVYSELEQNEKVALAGYHPNTGKWLRISGTAREDTTQKSRELVLAAYPILQQKYREKQEAFLAIYRICMEKADINLS